jgi:hypothetical protein
MSIPEETGKVAVSTIDALKGNPLCLAVVVLAITLSAITYFRDTATGHDRAEIVTSLIERCTPQHRGAPND